MNAQREYYAVRDITDGGVGVTYWYRNAGGIVSHWPSSSTRIGPFYTPENLAELKRLRQIRDTDGYKQLRHQASRAQHQWEQTIVALLATGPGRTAAMRLFSRLQMRCCICGRQLTDERSKVLGIGPECGEFVPDEVADRLAQLTGAAYERELS